MPIIKSAIKKVRKDKKRTAQNLNYLKSIKELFKKIKKGSKDKMELIKAYYSKIDKAVKKKVIHKNKGARLKSKVSKFLTK
jgi:small subunit ribosomal protein S20